MIRTVAAAALLGAALALAACQQGGGHGGGPRAAPDLAGAFARTYGAQVADAFPEGQRADVARCIGQAMASGIPLNDQFLIYDQLDTGRATPASRAAMQRWIGGAVATGPIRSSFTQSGGPGGDPAAARIDGNIQQFCAQYRDRLMKAGYIGAPPGGGPGGGFSKGK
ncbi:hypothetical protein [Dongia sp. agr-C8]